MSVLMVFLDVFQGFVISDFEGIDKMTDPPHANYTWSIQQSVLAGIDMVCLNRIRLFSYTCLNLLLVLIFCEIGVGHGWLQPHRIHRRIDPSCEERFHPNDPD